jgi:hypothetical protein
MPTDTQLMVYILCITISLALVAWATEHALRVLPPPRTAVHERLRPGGVKTGDLLLFSRAGSAAADAQKIFLGTPFSHVAVAAVDASGVAWVLESTPDHGVAIKRLSVCVADPELTVVLRRISRALPGAGMEAVVRMCVGQQYSGAFWRATAYAWTAAWAAVPDDEAADDSAMSQKPGGYFCSELVARVYAQLGVLDFSAFDKSPSMMLPADFTAAATPLPLVNSYSFGPEVALLPPPATPTATTLRAAPSKAAPSRGPTAAPSRETLSRATGAAAAASERMISTSERKPVKSQGSALSSSR